MTMSSDINNQAVISTILSRHCTRDFSPEPVSEKALNTILACAFSSPSSKNSQPWFVSVTDDPTFIKSMSDRTVAVLKEDPIFSKAIEGKDNFHVFYHAPLVLMISGKTEERALMLNSGIFLQNILLAAEAIGLGACPIGFARFLFEGNEADLYRKKLNIPENYTPVIGIALGNVAAASQRKPAYPMDWKSAHADKVSFIR